MTDHLPLVHLNLSVADIGRSTEFYGHWFGFTRPARTYPDGTVFLGNEDGFDLALHPGPPPRHPAPTMHFGFRSSSPEGVRALRASLCAGGVPIADSHDTDTYTGFKCFDPDGYEIEVYWEPQQRDAR